MVEEGVVKTNVLVWARAVPFTGTGSTRGLEGCDCFVEVFEHEVLVVKSIRVFSKAWEMSLLQVG